MSVATLDTPVAVREPIMVKSKHTFQRELFRLESPEDGQVFASRPALFEAVVHGRWNQGLAEGERFKNAEEVAEQFKKWTCTCDAPAQRGRVAGEYDPTLLQATITKLEVRRPFRV